MTESTLTGPAFGPAEGGKPEQLVVFLHGLGADGQDLIGLAPILAQVLPRALFVAPDAPQPCDMAPMGRQWFSLQERTDEMIAAGVRSAAPVLDAFIARTLSANDLDPSRLALFGFSQGCMMALHVGLRLDEAPAAVLGYSGRLADAPTLPAEIRSRPPVLLVHGEDDPVVPYESLAQAEAGLKAAGIEPEVLSRPGLGHGIDEEGIRAGAAFLLRHLPGQVATA